MPVIDIAGHHQAERRHTYPEQTWPSAHRGHILPHLPQPRGNSFSPKHERTHCRGNPALVGASIGTPVAGVLAVATGAVAVAAAAVAGVSLLLVGGCGEGVARGGGACRLPTDGRWP